MKCANLHHVKTGRLTTSDQQSSLVSRSVALHGSSRTVGLEMQEPAGLMLAGRNPASALPHRPGSRDAECICVNSANQLQVRFS